MPYAVCNCKCDANKQQRGTPGDKCHLDLCKDYCGCQVNLYLGQSSTNSLQCLCTLTHFWNFTLSHLQCSLRKNQQISVQRRREKNRSSIRSVSHYLLTMRQSDGNQRGIPVSALKSEPNYSKLLACPQHSFGPWGHLLAFPQRVPLAFIPDAGHLAHRLTMAEMPQCYYVRVHLPPLRKVRQCGWVCCCFCCYAEPLTAVTVRVRKGESGKASQIIVNIPLKRRDGSL